MKDVNLRSLRRVFVFFTFVFVLFGSQGVYAQDYTSLCSANNVRQTMCGASDGDNGDTAGMCQLDLSVVLEAHCGTVVGLMTRAVGFDGTSSQIEQQIVNVARASRRIVDTVVPSTEDPATLYNIIDLAMKKSAEASIIVLALKVADPLSAKISPNKFTDVMFEIIDVFRKIIKNAILPSDEFAQSCLSAVQAGKLFRFMANPETCRTVTQVSLDLAFNNLKAIYGLYSNDPQKIASGILGVTNTAAGIWADNLDLAVDIGQTYDKVKLREIETIVFEHANEYWPYHVKLDSVPGLIQEDYLYQCYEEVSNEVALRPSFIRWLSRTHHDYNWPAEANARCHDQYLRWQVFTEKGKYEALLVAVGGADRAGYFELFEKWFDESRRSQYANMWDLFIEPEELVNGTINRYIYDYERAAHPDRKLIEGSAARAVFGSGNTSTVYLMRDIFNAVNTFDSDNGDEQEFSDCLNTVVGGRPPTHQEFLICMLRGLELRKGIVNGENRVYVGHYPGISGHSDAYAFLKAIGIKGFDTDLLPNEMSEYDMIRLGVRLSLRLESAMDRWQSTVTSPR